jgi:hypothetical protein
VPPTLREFDLSGTKPILPRRRKRELSSKEAFRLEEEFGPRLPSHSIRPGLFSKLCSTFARPSQLGSASSSNELYTLSCATPYYRTAGADAPHPCQARTSNPSAAAKFPRRAHKMDRPNLAPLSWRGLFLRAVSDFRHRNQLRGSVFQSWVCLPHRQAPLVDIGRWCRRSEGLVAPPPPPFSG